LVGWTYFSFVARKKYLKTKKIKILKSKFAHLDSRTKEKTKRKKNGFINLLKKIPKNNSCI
jgi:hypothetical protein